MLLFNWYLVSLYWCFQCCVINTHIIGLNNGLKLFYLAADSVADATSTVVLAEPFIKPTGADKHQEERKKTGNCYFYHSTTPHCKLLKLIFIYRRNAAKN